MRATRRRLTGAVAMAAVAVVAAGCGGQSTPGLADVATTTASATGSSTTATAAGESTTAPAAGGSATTQRVAAGQPGPVPSVSPGATVGPAAPIDELVAVAVDMLGPTTDVAAELDRVGFFDPRVPVPSGGFDLTAFSVSAFTGVERGSGPTTLVTFNGGTSQPAATIDAFYTPAKLGADWEQTVQSKVGDDLRTTFRLVATKDDAHSLDVGYWRDSHYSTPDSTVFVVSVEPLARPDDTDAERLAGWSPDVKLPAGAALASSSIDLNPTDQDEALLGLTIGYHVAGGDAAKLATDTAAALGLTGWKLTERAGGSVTETFDLDPLPGLESRRLQIATTPTGASLTISGSRSVPAP